MFSPLSAGGIEMKQDARDKTISRIPGQPHSHEDLPYTCSASTHSFIHSPVLNDTLQDIQQCTGTDLAFKQQPPALVHCPCSGLCKLHCRGSVDQCSKKFTAFSQMRTVKRVLGFLFCIYYLSYRVILKYQLPCHIPQCGTIVVFIIRVRQSSALPLDERT